jgi:valyl-tRNA synthetase
MSTMGWPDSAAAAKETGVADFPSLLPAFNPTSTLCTAREIITLWVSRMVMFNRYFTANQRDSETTKQGEAVAGSLPFRDVFIHCVVQDGQGRKMSKSLGNGVDPLDIIASHGSDAMRFTVCNMSTNTQDVRLPVKKDPATGKNTSEKFDLGRNFANKVWNAASFALRNLSLTTETQRHGEGAGVSLPDRWMLSRLAAAVAEVESALANFEFSSYAQTVYDLLWRDFCDWYLEAIKPTVAQDAGQRAVLAATLDTILRLLHPIMPYVTEAIYEEFSKVSYEPIPEVTLEPPRKGGLLATADWPQLDESCRNEKAELEFERIRSLVTAIREVRANQNVHPKRRVTLHAPPPRSGAPEPHYQQPGLETTKRQESEALIRTLAGVANITTEAPRTGVATVEFTSEGVEYRLSDLADAVDATAEKARLTKLIADLEKSVSTFEGRLANPGYAAKAPPAMVQQTKDQMEKAKAELAAARKGLEALGS